MKSLAMIALLLVSAAIVGGQGDDERLQNLLRSQQRFQRGGALLMQQHVPSNEVTRLELRIQQLEDTVRTLQQRIEALERKATTPQPPPIK
jgi:hypothetical protein